MQIPIYHVNAFAHKVFSGNPAAVCVLSSWLDDDVMHAIAKENNLPATVFLVRDNGNFNIRWITPEYELDLCGHGTLAAAFVIFNYLDSTLQSIDFKSRKEILKAEHAGDFIKLNFPAKKLQPWQSDVLVEGLGAKPQEIYQHENDRCIAVFETETEVGELKPNMEILKKLPHRGISVTARSSKVDFVSRTFYPQKSISEDPATGASHCVLAPYWSSILKKNKLHALQLSARGGEIFCEHANDRVLIFGKGILFSEGAIFL